MTLSSYDAPVGFDLAKYQSFETMTTYGWSEAVMRRLPLALQMERGGLPESIVGRCRIFDIVRGIVDEPGRVPPPRFRPSAIPVPADTTTADPSFRDRKLSALNSLTLLEARFIAEYIRDEGLHAKPSVESISDGLSRYFDDIRMEGPSKYRCVTSLPKQYVGVDVERPTEVIEREFRQWLKAAKRARGIRAIGDGIRREKWIADRLLPCFDLTAYAWSEDDRYPDDRMFDLLFPHDLETEFPAKRIKQTIRPNAFSLVSMSTYSHLFHASQRDGSPFGQSAPAE